MSNFTRTARTFHRIEYVLIPDASMDTLHRMLDELNREIPEPNWTVSVHNGQLVIWQDVLTQDYPAVPKPNIR